MLEAGLVLAIAGFVPGCATTTPAPSSLPAPIPLPSPRPPLPDFLTTKVVREGIERELRVVPFTTGDRSEPELMRALALAQLMLHTLENDHDLNPLGLETHARPGPNAPRDPARLLDPKPLLAKIAKGHSRYVLGGHLAGERLTLWLMDRDDGKVFSRETSVDLPRLFMPRFALAALLGDAGVPPNELTRADMTWYEELDADALVTAGRALFALDFAEDASAAVDEARREAPMSYLVAALDTRHALRREANCGPRMLERYTHMTALHRAVPTFIEASLAVCRISPTADGDTLELPAWSKRGDATCRIGAKALTALGAGRGSLSGDHSLGPRSSFVTGLGGIYRGDTCEAGIAVSGLADDEPIPPWTRAGLELEAAFFYYADGQARRAERWFEKARESAARGEDRPCIQQLFWAEATLGLADLDVEHGRHDEATSLLSEAENIATKCLDPRMLGRIANSRGILAQGQSRMDTALEAFNSAHDTFNRLGDEMNIAVALTNLGVTWLHLGRHDKAIPLLEQALVGKERVRSKGGIAALHENLGVAELARGNADEAENHFARSLELATDPQTRATLLVQMARLALARGDGQKAQAFMDEAQELSKRVHARVLTAVMEQVKASMAVDSGRFQDALADFHSALAIRRSLGDRMGEGITLTLLMQVAHRMDRPALAIMYGKLAVAAHEEVRQSAKAIDAETARQFVASRAETYRALASRLVESGRLIEAERVLALLKEDEASTWTRSAATAAVPLTTAEKELEGRYRELADHVMALGREHAELAQKASHTSAEKARLEVLRGRLAAANNDFLEFLGSLGESDTLARSKTLESLREDAGIGPDLADLGPGHVAVYTLVGKDALHLIVVSPDAQTGRSVRLEPGMLDAMVASLREALMDPSSDPKPIARELYELILRPIEKDLAAAKAKTILWSLDRTLRYLPVAALWDGQRWAIERWSHSVFTPASHARLKDQPGEWKVLGLGVTRGHPPFSPLPAVGKELDAIIGTAKDRLPGVVALDKDFTKERLVTELGRRYPVVHLASHFAFAPGDKDNSFLLLGDGSKLTVSELERLPNLFAGVDLLTLSACNTATGDLPGDGQEVESFAVLAQRKGARAVFATLWPVADQSTGWLMSRFYRQRKVPKVLALREAQLDMIRGQADPKWQHPYHWGPFIVIGNTR
jgi:CHAT domain-containing protein/Tfp pilus assembly protein PilF